MRVVGVAVADGGSFAVVQKQRRSCCCCCWQFWTASVLVVAVLLTRTTAAQNSSDAASNNFNFTCALPETPTQLIGDQLTVKQVINPLDQTMAVELTYQGEAWLGFGVPDPSSSNHMTGANVVIGQPANAGDAPLKYQIGQMQALSAITPFPTDQQNLINATVTQSNGVTVLSYVQVLPNSSTTNELAIASLPNQTQEFIYAVGYSNTFALHQYKGWITLLIPQCTANGTSSVNNTNATSSGGASSTPMSKQAQRAKNIFRSHGLMMMFAFGACVPIAVAASLLRNILPGETWFTLHTMFNTCATISCLAAFALAVYQIQMSKAGPHFGVENHRPIGLAITCAVCVQVILGMCRPKVVKEAPPPSAASVQESLAALEEHKPVPTGPQKSGVRYVWEIMHRLMGLGIVGLAWYNCYIGMKLYQDRYSEPVMPHEQLAFWSVAAGVLGIGFVGWALLRKVG